MLERSELRVLGAVEEPASRQELVERLDYAPGTVSNSIRRLVDLGLVVRNRSGRQSVVRPADTTCTETYHALVRRHPHVSFPDLLTPTLIELLYYLTDDPATVAELVARGGLARSTVYSHLDTLQNRAMVKHDDGTYWLAEAFVGLHEFAQTLYHRAHRQQMKSDIGRGWLVWEAHDEFLVETDRTLDDPTYHVTGLDAFADYGLEFFTTSSRYYWYAERRGEPGPAALVSHLLVIENDARHRKYALLLLATTDVDRETLVSTASRYGVSDTVEGLYDYLATDGAATSALTPSWDEFQTLATEYGMTV